MRKLLLLLVIPISLSVQKANAQTSDETVRESLGALLAAQILSTYSSVTTSVNTHIAATGAKRDTALTHVAFCVGTTKTTIEYLRKLEKLDMFTEDDIHFLKGSITILEKLKGLSETYLLIVEGHKTTNMDKYQKDRADVRKSIFDLLEMDELTF